MEVLNNIPSSKIKYLPIDGGGSDIQNGALVGPGLTAEQDMSVWILAAADGADAIGIITELHDFSVTGDSTPESAAAYVNRRVVPILPGQEVGVEYDISDTVAATGASTTSVTATSLEDNLDGGWLYFPTGDAIGQLAYIIASAAGTATVDTLTTAVASGDTFIKIMRPGKTLIKMNAARTKLGSDAAAGTWTARVIKNQIKYDNSAVWEDLDPAKYSNKQLNGLNPVFRAIVVPVNTYYNPID
jgi:hypothetical protein